VKTQYSVADPPNRSFWITSCSASATIRKSAANDPCSSSGVRRAWRWIPSARLRASVRDSSCSIGR